MSTRNILSKRCENDIEKQYDFYWHGILVGIVIVPLNEDKPVDFVANSVINMDVARLHDLYIKNLHVIFLCNMVKKLFY